MLQDRRSARSAFLQRLPLYIGGFMGPFGTVVIVPMFPELRDQFDASSSAVSLGFSLYLIPFAALLLVSGTLGERWGRRRTVRGTYLLYAVASIGCALAPNLTVFIAARALQGVANAFITPLLLAGLAETVPAERFGRQVGIYSSFQAFGGGLGPIVGGIAADTNWRLAFWGTMAISLVLALAPPKDKARRDAAAPSLRPLLTGRMIALGVAFLFAAAGPVGISVLVGVAARDVLELSGTATGLVLFGGAMSALLLGPTWGQVLDRFGARAVGLAAATSATVLAGLPSLAGSGWTLAVIWIIASAAISAVVVVFQALGASIMPENRGGALSFLLSFRFVGHAVGPIVFVPLIDWSARGAFFMAAGLGLVTTAVIGTFRTS
ncbi:MAG: MFS family permease [Acidimicrobiales bacterium]|jgi:MFS family permease